MISITIIFILTYIVFNDVTRYQFLPKETTTILKALLPFGVLLHHVNLNYNVLEDFNQAGYYIVGLFFFISGYGLEFKISKEEKNIEHLLVRIKKLLLPLVVPSLLYVGIKVFVYNLCIRDILEHAFVWKIILPYSWFVVVLIILTISLFLLARICNSTRKRLSSLFVFVLLFMVVCRLSEVQSTFYVSTPVFWLGAFCHYKKDTIEKYMKSPWRYTVLVCLGLSVFLALHPFPFSTCLNTSLYGGGIIAIVSNVPMNQLFEKLSSISYEQYLCQGITFAVMPIFFNKALMVNALDSLVLFLFLIVLTNIFVATICHRITTFLQNS